MVERTKEIIARIDERTLIMGKDVTEIKAHLIKLNGFVIEHENRIATVEEKAENTESKTEETRRFMSRLFIAFVTSIGAGVVAAILKFTGVW